MLPPDRAVRNRPAAIDSLPRSSARHSPQLHRPGEAAIRASAPTAGGVRRGARRAAPTRDKERTTELYSAVRNSRRPAIPYPVAQRATHLSSTDQPMSPSAHRHRPRVAFGAALVARLRQGIKRRRLREVSAATANVQRLTRSGGPPPQNIAPQKRNNFVYTESCHGRPDRPSRR
jgi:hypothetical protein